MDKGYTINIAGIHIAITCDHPKVSQAIYHRYHPFLADNGASFEVNVHWEKSTTAGSFITPEITFFPERIQLSAPGFRGYGDFPNKIAELNIHVINPVDAVDYFLRVIFAILAYQSGGIMVHGAGILHKGKGYLFYGHSGSGKTTIARSSVYDVVLNDDLVALFHEENAWTMFSTPFWNPTQVSPKPISAPLSAMFYLIQDQSVFLEPINTAQALAEFISSIPVISQNPVQSLGIMERGRELLECVPANRLHFLPDGSFWQAIDE